jgi:L-alanine-DL-glutamate epimerase-like enolase superfamily enzyme
MRAASLIRREHRHRRRRARCDEKRGLLGARSREALQRALPPGAARNALDCVFWDLDAKRAYRSVAELAELGAVTPVVTAFTLALDTPEKMAEPAARTSPRRSPRSTSLSSGKPSDAE